MGDCGGSGSGRWNYSPGVFQRPVCAIRSESDGGIGGWGALSGFSRGTADGGRADCGERRGADGEGIAGGVEAARWIAGGSGRAQRSAVERAVEREDRRSRTRQRDGGSGEAEAGAVGELLRGVDGGG